MTSPRLEQLADATLDVLGRADPVDATTLGMAGYDHLLPDVSAAGQAALRSRVEGLLVTASALDPSALSDDERITHDLVEHHLRAVLARLDAHTIQWATGVYNSPAATPLSLVRLTAVTSEDAAAYTARLEGLAELAEEMVQQLRAGIQHDRVGTRRGLETLADQLDAFLTPADDNPLVAIEVDPQLGEAPVWRARWTEVVAGAVVPAIGRLQAVLREEIAPIGRPDERAGICHLPHGQATYATQVALHTTTALDADTIHQVGRQIVAELDEEYTRLGRQVLGVDDPREVRRRMRDDPALRFTSAGEIRSAAEESVRRAEAHMAHFVHRPPRTSCRVRPFPPALAPEAPLGAYDPPAADGSRPGTFWVNTHQPHARARYEAEALAFHEAIPGHHLQFARAHDQLQAHPLRRLTYVTAYSEGWGLYSERLADEVGLYSSPLQQLGLTTHDSWRACRLVVDTGLHHLGWPRQQAVDYLLDHTAAPAHNIEVEVDRYITWPGQALGYMIGRREIRRQRVRAHDALGNRFDLPAFHDMILDLGSVPLSALDGAVDRWVADQRA